MRGGDLAFIDLEKTYIDLLPNHSFENYKFSTGHLNIDTSFIRANLEAAKNKLGYVHILSSYSATVGDTLEIMYDMNIYLPTMGSTNMDLQYSSTELYPNYQRTV